MKTHHSSFIIHNSSLPRRGVLLLVVLAILTLFALIAVAFVVLSGQAQRSAKSIERFEQVIDPPDKLLHQAAMQVFRGPTTNLAGTPDPASVMQAHSLLEDIYGNEYVFGTLSIPGAYAGGTFTQLLDLTLGQLSYYDTSGNQQNYTDIVKALSRRVGCVLTITGIPAGSTVLQQALLGQSTRIVAANTGSPTVQVVAFPNGAWPPIDTEFTINGVPFSGTGFGYDATNRTLDATDPTITLPSGANPPLALLPNDRNANPNPLGGANEDYDAADFQNMLLAAQVVPTGGTAIQTLPSLHRPALVRYWADQITPAADFTNPDNLAGLFNAIPDNLKRQIVLRPLPTDHFNFTGSNPKFNPVWDGSFVPDPSDPTQCRFSWDVDNDGDGVTDSVWVDLGMPVRATTDGRLYKPLFAILCVDLDGRLNLNAHGSLPQTDTAHYGNPIFPIGGTLAVGGVSARGQGLGPADINLGYLLDPTYPLNATYSNRLMSAFNGYLGRYGSTLVPGLAGPDTLSANKWFEYGPDYWNFTNVNMAGSFGSPPDVFGVGAVGLDLAGRPLYIGMNYQGLPAQYVGYGSGVTNSPYELNLDPNQTRGVPSSIATVDNPFSPAELERILRPFDRDAPSLPDRLPMLTLDSSYTPPRSELYNVRHSLTTESWDLPCPNVVTPSSLSTTELGRLTDGRVKHITDLLLARGVPASKWAKLLPADLLAGLRMNINRPLGNGRDDLGSGVVDDPAENTAQQVMLSNQTVNTISFDGISGATSPITSLQARQLMARHLYVLVFTLADRASLRSHFGGSANDTARAVAQWAVNVVDFRDRDNIMTPFNFDPRFASDNPIADWNPPNNARYIAWGCERPELLITETTAFHDRKTEDTQDDPTGKDTKDTEDPDDDFDQKSKPQGSLFVELYNPAGPFDPPAGGSYESVAAGGSNVGCVQLNQTTPVPEGHPVWRLLIANTNSTNDPDHPTTKPVPDRSVYFADPTTANPSRDGAVQYYTTSTDISPILPGRYAVIGPATETLVGTRTDTLDAQTRKIKLMENALPDSSPDQVSVERNRDTTNDINDLPADTKPPVAVVVNQSEPVSRRMSVSEPTDGYPDVGPSGFYEPQPKDQPFDEARGDPALKINGTTPNYRIVHLQRLANPRKPYLDVTAAGQLPTPTEDYNPYVTIDSQPIDLTVFNGLDSSEDPKNLPDTVMFASRQRGETNDTSTDGVNNLWKQDLSPNDPASDPTPKDSSDPHHIFKYVLRHTLGYLNEPFGPPRPDPNDPRVAPDGWRSYRGDPATGPFPWLTWNNRPYVSQMELMLVPWLRSSQLLRTYSLAQAGDNPYTNPTQPFSHLMNLFVSGTSGEDEELHRVLEYLGVPSPFVGTGTWANPNLAASTAGHAFHPPFSRISAYREPGRINLNTIYSQGVFDGLMNGFPGLNWAQFVRSRRHDGQNEVLDTPPTNCPTEFSRPFRSFGGASLVPTLTGNPLKYDREIDATLLREGSTSGSPLLQYTSPNPVNDTNRSPYFRYQGIQRLGNLVTTRSNVYAVWITVGYFEVQSVGGTSPVHPDGYRLGRELGMDTGEIERHRAFYIFDRSIPVGFQRGQDLNVEKAILVDRFIE